MDTTEIRSFDDFLALFSESPRQKIPNGWNVICPAHQDKNPSLSLTQEGLRILVHCQAGCKTEDVLKPKGLTISDLLLDSHQPELDQRKEVAIYKYQGFEVVRYKPKDFRQRRSDGNGGYIWNLEGIVRTLYHQDDLPDAIDNGMTIYIVEGEKDVDRLRSLGLIATCNSGGAGKWLPQYTAALKGADWLLFLIRIRQGTNMLTR